MHYQHKSRLEELYKEWMVLFDQIEAIENLESHSVLNRIRYFFSKRTLQRRIAQNDAEEKSIRRKYQPYKNLHVFTEKGELCPICKATVCAYELHSWITPQ